MQLCFPCAMAHTHKNDYIYEVFICNSKIQGPKINTKVKHTFLEIHGIYIHMFCLFIVENLELICSSGQLSPLIQIFLNRSLVKMETVQI